MLFCQILKTFREMEDSLHLKTEPILIFVNDFLNGDIPRSVFWEYAKFKHPTHQISFHSIRALDCLVYKGSELVNEHK